MRKYLKLVERTEQEVLVHFMLINGNEAAIKSLIRLVNKLGHCINMSVAPGHSTESQVLYKCEQNKGKYLRTFGRNDCKQDPQTFDDILSTEEFAELFYKGGIRNFGLDWYKYQNRLYRD